MNSDPKVEEKRKQSGRAKGCQKSGGRTKGTPNKKSLWLREEFSRSNFDWMNQLTSAIEAKDHKMVELLIALLPYLNPKIKDAEFADFKEDSQDKSEKQEEPPTQDTKSILAGLKT